MATSSSVYNEVLFKGSCQSKVDAHRFELMRELTLEGDEKRRTPREEMVRSMILRINTQLKQERKMKAHN